VKITAIITACLVAGTLMTAGPAQAELTAQPALSPIQKLQNDARSEVQELLRQISELDDQWDGLSPAERNQRIAGLQQQVTVVDRDTRNLPPEQRPEVEAMLGVAVVRLADILRKEQTPPTSPCVFPLCLPGL
jgi:NhaP-type Na+/H+ and K+/H+ antiporter